jgi:hypothetical protein
MHNSKKKGFNHNIKGGRVFTKKHKLVDITTHKPTINTLFDFFNIATNCRDYLRNSLYDGIGIYSLVNWYGPKNYTYDDIVKKIIQTDTIKILGLNTLKIKPFYVEGSIQKSSVSKREYMYMGTFLRTENDYSDDIITLKCDVMRNIIDGNYIINFKWGVRANLSFNKLAYALDKMCEFITDKLHSTNWKNNNILLIGYSMGGNIAQHIALRLLQTKYNQYIYILSLGIGGTLDTAAIKSRIERGLAKRFISIAILNSNSNYHTKQLPPKYNLNTYILPDKNTKTIKTLIVHTKLIIDKNTLQVSKHNIKGYYDYEKTFPNLLYDSTIKNKLHELKYYRSLLEKLISGTD